MTYRTPVTLFLIFRKTASMYDDYMTTRNCAVWAHCISNQSSHIMINTCEILKPIENINILLTFADPLDFSFYLFISYLPN